MAYIGKTPTIGNFQVCDAISVVNGQAAYTMQVNSVNVVPESAFHMLVSLNGILQKSGSSFTVSGSTITFASNLVTGDVIDFIQILGSVLDLGVPSDATVTAAKLASTSITGQTAEATVADDDLVLLSDTSASAALKKMTVANLTANAGTAGLTSSSGNITITDGDLIFGGAGHGVYLGVTSATAANHLDDYEEGSFTPAYAFDSGSVAMQSGSRGHYVKVGNLVHFQIYMATDSISSPSGDATITGLPFTSGDESSSSAVIGLLYRFGTDFDGELKVRVGQDSTVLSPFKNASNSTSSTRFQGSDFTSGTAYNNLHVAGCYATF